MATDKNTSPDKPIELEDADIEQAVGGQKLTGRPVTRPTVTLNDPCDGGE